MLDTWQRLFKAIVRVFFFLLFFDSFSYRYMLFLLIMAASALI